MSYSDTQVWIIITVLAIGTFVIRFSFLGLVGDRPLPPWAARMLRYTPVALIPGIVAPLVVSPAATGGAFDPARAIAAVVALLVGLATRNTLAAIAAGALTLYPMLWWLG